MKPKPLYESSEAKAYLDVPVFAEHEHLLQNRVDAGFVIHKEKTLIAVEMNFRGLKIEWRRTTRRRGNMAPRHGNRAGKRTNFFLFFFPYVFFFLFPPRS